MSNARPPVPSDYDTADGYDDDTGCEKCPHCGKEYSLNGGYFGEVVSQDGTHYDYPFDPDPGEGPHFCIECWPELERNRNAQANHGLGDFA